jgi:hypothetical protein
MSLDLLDVLALLGAAAQMSPEGRNPLTLRLTLADACDVAIDFLRQACRSEEFKLNEAQYGRLREASSEFRTTEDDRKLLEPAEGAAVGKVETILRTSMKSISDQQFSVGDGLALIEVLDQTRTLLRSA